MTVNERRELTALRKENMRLRKRIIKLAFDDVISQLLAAEIIGVRLEDLRKMDVWKSAQKEGE